MRRLVGNCLACFEKGCRCECDTCAAARERNDRLSQAELTALMVAILAAREEG